MQKQKVGFGLMAISAIGLALGTILMKQIPLRTSMTPGHVAVWRFAISAPLMWLITLTRQKKSERPQEKVWALIGLGLIYSAASLSALLALGQLSSSLYAIIVYIYPSLVVAYGLITRSPVPRLWWVGLPLTLFGLALTVFHFGQPLQVDVLGVVLSVLNGVIIAVYNILSAKVFARVHNQQLGTTWVNTGAMLAGLGLIFVFGFNLPDSLVGWSLLIALGIFGTLVPILALNAGLQMVGAARGSVIMTMQPVIAVLISTIFLGDVLTPQQWIGGAVVILAIVLLQRSPDRAAKTDGI